MRYWSSVTAGVRENRARHSAEGYLIDDGLLSACALSKEARGKSTRAALTKACNIETFMTDGGPVFDNAKVRKFCES